MPYLPPSHFSLRPFPGSYPVAMRAYKNAMVLSQNPGMVLAPAVGIGNYKTRNFRQKPIVGLQKFNHKPNPNRNFKAVTKKTLLAKSKAMPYRKKTSHKVAKRSARRVKRSHRKLPPLIQPRSKLIRMRYVTTGTFSGAGGAIDVKTIKANSLADPTGAISTALPLGLDQWSSFYSKYIVIGSKLTIRFGATTNTGPVVVGCHLDNNATALTSVNHYRELPLTKQKTLTTQKDYAVITMKYAGRRFWKLTNIKDDSEQEATFSTTPGDPTDIAYYHVFIQDFVGSNNANVDVQVEEEFLVLLTDPVTLAQSAL